MGGDEGSEPVRRRLGCRSVLGLVVKLVRQLLVLLARWGVCKRGVRVGCPWSLGKRQVLGQVFLAPVLGQVWSP